MPTRTTTLRAAWRPCSVAAESRLANARPGAAPDVLRVSLPKARRFPVLELGAIYPLTQIGRIVSPSHLWSRANLRGGPYPPPAAPHRTVATRPLRGP